MKAIRIHETGGPEVMHLEEIETPTPKAGEILIVEIFSFKIHTKLVQINDVFWPQIKYNVTGYLSAFGQ